MASHNRDVDVCIRVDQLKPLEGTISALPAADGVPFSGWLELLRLLDDVLSPEGAEDIDATAADDV